MIIPDMHPLLQRQLRLLAKNSGDGKVSTKDILEIVNQRYQDCDKAQCRLERSISITSEELVALYENAKMDKKNAEAASLSKSLFLANMSHEIRTPLNGVLGFINLLFSTELTETQKEYLDIAQTSGKSLLSLLNDILDLSKIESGNVDLETISFNLQHTIESCIDVFRSQLTNHTVDMNCYIDPQLACFYMGDPERLSQIITNFVSNALKFTSEGSVGVEVHTMSGRTGKTQPIQIRISDTGIGISAENQKKVFENFIQADLSTTREYGGTGLGLAISSHLASLMGGKISLESELGKGSTFILDINLTEAPNNTGTILASCDVASLKGRHALVVDDTAINRRYFEAQLQDYGMSSKTVEDYDQALEYLSSPSKPVDIIITDHLMPVKDGIELIEAIRSRSELTDIPIILSSSSGDARARFPDAQYDAFVPKPVIQKTLLDTLNSLLQSSEGLTSKIKPIIPESTAHRILVAEDNYINQKLIEQALSGLGYVIDTVANGEEAVRAVSTLHYDVILMDIRMPIMNGIEATQEIRALQNGNEKVPIIALTGNTGRSEQEKYLKAGMDDYLAKPVNLAILRDLIVKWKEKTSQAAEQPEVSMAAFI